MLRMYNLKDGKINTSDLQYVELEPDLLNAFRLTKGDLLFNRTNSYELVGKVSLFELQGDFVFASYLVRLAVDRNQLSPFYLNSYWTLAIFRPFRVEIKSRRR